MTRPKKKRPPQGTHSIISAKREAIMTNAARAMLHAVKASIADPIVADLAEAKREGDQAKIASALKLYLDKYGRGREALRMFRAL